MQAGNLAASNKDRRKDCFTATHICDINSAESYICYIKIWTTIQGAFYWSY